MQVHVSLRSGARAGGEAGGGMKQPKSVRTLEDLGRVQLSPNFFLRDFLYSEIAAIHGIPNIPEDPDLAIAAGKKLCVELLEPLQATFGRIAIRSAYRSAAVNALGNRKDYSCGSNEANYAGHIWDRRDADGHMGATACIVVPWFLPRYRDAGDWRPLAWWIHDHLPYSDMEFFPKLAAFNLTWHEKPWKTISSYAAPQKGVLTKPGMANHAGSHAMLYPGFPPPPTSAAQSLIEAVDRAEKRGNALLEQTAKRLRRKGMLPKGR